MASTFKKLDSVTVGAGGVSSVSFTNIPSGYTDLVIKSSTRTTGTNGTFFVHLNGTSTNSATIRLYSASGVNSGGSGFANSYWDYGNYSSTLAGTFSNSEVYLPGYTNNGIFKTVAANTILPDNSTAWSVITTAGQKQNTEAVTSITIAPVIDPLIAQYSTFTLYGVFNQEVSSVPATPTIGTATDAGTGTSALVAFTGVSGAASYTATSTPGSFAGVGNQSPIAVGGLTTGTAYTFKVKANNPLGSSAESAASNSVTPALASGYYSIASADAVGTSSITFSSIPSSFRQLQIRFDAMSALGATGWSNIYMRINGDTGSNYGMNFIFADSANLSTGTSIPNTYVLVGDAYNNSNTENSYGIGIIDILEYANPNKKKTVSVVAGQPTSVSSWEALQVNGWWNDTSAITSITLFTNNGSNFKASSYFSLYGIV